MNSDVKTVMENETQLQDTGEANNPAQSPQDPQSKFSIKVTKKPVPATPRGVLAE
jgi:hypothetical protein